MALNKFWLLTQREQGVVVVAALELDSFRLISRGKTTLMPFVKNWR